MKNLTQFFFAFAILFSIVSCQKDSQVFNADEAEDVEMVYLNDELTPMSSIDYDDDNLVILFINEDDVNGRMYTNRDLMKAWVGKHEDSKSILEILESTKKMSQYIKDNKLDNESIPMKKRQTSADEYLNQLLPSNEKVPVKISVWEGTNFSGQTATYTGPTIRLQIGYFADNLRSFKAWGAGVSGYAAFYSNPYLSGSQSVYYRAFFRKKSTLGGLNNTVESYVNL